jgi:transposase
MFRHLGCLSVRRTRDDRSWARVFRCVRGYIADRDENAAWNILQLGQSYWAQSSPLGGLAHEAVPL